MIVIIHDQAKLFWGGWVSRMFLLSFSVSEGEGARGSQLTTMLKDHSHGERLKFLESSVCIRKRPKQETSNLLQNGVSEEIRSNFCKFEKFPCCVFSSRLLTNTHHFCSVFPLITNFSWPLFNIGTSTEHFQHWYKCTQHVPLFNASLSLKKFSLVQSHLLEGP